jgi:hypothetical protein
MISSSMGISVPMVVGTVVRIVAGIVVGIVVWDECGIVMLVSDIDAPELAVLS